MVPDFFEEEEEELEFRFFKWKIYQFMGFFWKYYMAKQANL